MLRLRTGVFILLAITGTYLSAQQTTPPALNQILMKLSGFSSNLPSYAHDNTELTNMADNIVAFHQKHPLNDLVDSYAHHLLDRIQTTAHSCWPCSCDEFTTLINGSRIELKANHAIARADKLLAELAAE